MLQALWDVASPVTWAILSLASVFLLAGFVLLSHTLVRSKAYGDGYGGMLNPGRYEWTLRVGVGCLAVGFWLWAYEMAAPGWVLIVLGGLAVTAFGLEVGAVARRESTG